MATACFIVRAVFTTCGKNIFPAPNSSPTVFIPFISGPSMTFTALPYTRMASDKSVSRFSDIPLINAYSNLSSKVISSLISFFSTVLPFCRFFNSSARIISFSVASGFRFSITSSMTERTSFGMSVYVTEVPGLTIPISIPALIA